MLRTLLASRRARHHAQALYGVVVAAARDPVIFRNWNVADTMNGRLAVLVLTLVPLLHRLRSGAGMQALSQNLFDAFVDGLGRDLRDAGVGDTVVPKRQKKVLRIFYGHAKAFDEAVAAPDVMAALQRLIVQNVPFQGGDEGATSFARHLARVHQHLQEMQEADLVDPSSIAAALSTTGRSDP